MALFNSPPPFFLSLSLSFTRPVVRLILHISFPLLIWLLLLQIEAPIDECDHVSLNKASRLLSGESMAEVRGVILDADRSPSSWRLQCHSFSPSRRRSCSSHPPVLPAPFGNPLFLFPSSLIQYRQPLPQRPPNLPNFDKEEAAHAAIQRLNGMLINDKQVFVGLFVRRQERYQGNGSPKFTNVYVKNLSEAVTDEDLREIFGPFGTITSCVLMKDANGNSRGFGFVNFEHPDSAASAVEKLNGSTHDDKVWYVGRAQKKAEREAELKAKFEQERISRYEKLQCTNLYMKNLDDSINDEKLKEMFSEFGTVTSCKVMLDTKGASKGSGFVAFSTPEEATRALAEMNGKMVGRKPLYVAVAQRKEERKARLQVIF